MKTKIRKTKPHPNKVDVEELRKLVKTWRDEAEDHSAMTYNEDDTKELNGRRLGLESCADDLEWLTNNPDNS